MAAAACADTTTESTTVAEWTLAPTAAIEIGASDGDERYLFGRVASVLPLAENRILVADRQVARLRIYDEDGGHVEDVGTVRGSGPGEFQEIEVARPYRGDSIAVYDRGNGRMAILGPSGTIVRTVSISPDFSPGPGTVLVVANVQFVGTLDDGRFVFLGPERVPIEYQGRTRGVRMLIAHGPDGRELGPIVNTEGMLHQFEQRSQPLTFSGTTEAAARGNRILYGNAVEFTIQVFLSGGGAGPVYTGSGKPRRVTDGVIEQHHAALRRLLGNQMREGPPRQELYAETLPTYERMLLGSDGSLWVEHFRLLTELDQSRTYSVFDTSGAEHARLRLPARSELMEVVGRRAYVVERDDQDVQYVRIYDIVES
jgi:hypothetical protein